MTIKLTLGYQRGICIFMLINIFFISQHFVEEDFYAYVHERCLSSFGIRVTLALQNELKSVSVSFF